MAAFTYTGELPINPCRHFEVWSTLSTGRDKFIWTDTRPLNLDRGSESFETQYT